MQTPHTSYAHFAHHTATVMRWLRLMEFYGGHTAALEALLRDAQNLDRLMSCMRSHGMDPSTFIREAELSESGTH
jgi:hypothetical protein